MTTPAQDKSTPRCWFWSHQWSKWQTIERGEVSRKDSTFPLTGEPRVVGRYEYQRAVCQNCGKARLREINV